MAKILYESLEAYRKANGLERNQLNEEQLNESIASQYQELNKDDDKAVKAFTQALVMRKYISPTGSGTTDATKKILTDLINKMDTKTCLSMLETAMADGFKGRPYVSWANPEKTAKIIKWKKAEDLNLASSTQHSKDKPF